MRKNNHHKSVHLRIYSSLVIIVLVLSALSLFAIGFDKSATPSGAATGTDSGTDWDSFIESYENLTKDNTSNETNDGFEEFFHDESEKDAPTTWIGIRGEGSGLEIDIIWPPNNLNAIRGELFNVTAEVCCRAEDCGLIDVSLDPHSYTIDWGVADDAIFTDVVVDSQLNAYVSGYENMGMPGLDYIIKKFDKDGNEVWSRTYGTLTSDRAYSIAVDDENNVFVTGTYGSDIATVSYDSDGNIRWSDTYNFGSTDQGSSIALDSNGNTYACGYSNINRGWGYYSDHALIKADRDGNQQWQKAFNASRFDEYCRDIAVSSATEFYTVGDNNNQALYLYKFDEDGNGIWNKTYTTPVNSNALSVGADSEGNVYFLYINSTFTLAKYSSDGTLVTRIVYPRGSYDGPDGQVTRDLSNNVYVVFVSRGIGWAYLESYKYDSELNELGSSVDTIPSASTDVQGLAVDKLQNMFLALTDHSNDLIRSVAESPFPKGLIPFGSGTPFFTTVANPYQISLNQDKCQNVTWYVNATDPSGATWDFFVYANLTAFPDISNESSHWNVTIVDAPVPNLTIRLISPTSNVNISQNSFFDVAVELCCDNAECDNTELFLDPLEGCDPNAGTCSETCDVFSDTVTEWVWLSGAPFSPNDLCLNGSGNEIYKILDDSACDSALLFGDGPCAGWSSSSTSTEIVCPSFEREGSAVTSGDCMCTEGPCLPDEFPEFDFDHEFFSGVSGGISEKGLVNTTIGAEPFYTVNPNPFHTDIGEDECKNFIWHVNASGAIDSEYEFFSYVLIDDDTTTRKDSSEFNLTIVENNGVPTLAWDWDDVNSTIFSSETTIAINASEPVNCTLDFDGTTYSNESLLTRHSWELDSILLGSYDVSITCTDFEGNSATVGPAWVAVSTVRSLSLDVVYPTGDIEVMQGNLFNVTAEVCCYQNDCGAVNVSLDPQSYVEQWSSTYSESNHRALDVAVSDSGDSYVTGYFRDGENNDCFTIKFDSEGNQVWNRTYDSSNGDQCFSVVLDDSENVYVTGYVNYNAALTISYDSAGNQRWVDLYDTVDANIGDAISIDDQGNVYVCGTYTDPVTGKDIFLIKYDSNGNRLWNHTQDLYADDNYCVAVEIGPQDSINILGEFDESADDLLLMKYDSDLNLLWDELRDFSIFKYIEDMALDSKGNIYVAMLLGTNFTLYKYSPEATLLDALHFPRTIIDITIITVDVDSQDNVYLSFTPTTNMGVAYFEIYKFDSELNQLWGEVFNGEGYDYCTSDAIYADRSQNILSTRSCQYSDDVLAKLSTTSPLEKGLIPHGFGVPFYTTTPNPYQTDLDRGECTTITWTVNATGDYDTTWEFFTYANITNSPSINNESSHWNVTITELRPTLTVDVLSPPYDKINVTKDKYFDVSVRVCCENEDCNDTEISLDPIAGCDPDSSTCTDVCGGFFEDSPTEWDYVVDVYGPLSPDVCVNYSSGMQYTVYDDFGCDDFWPGADGPCTEWHDGVGTWILCPSYDRWGAEVTSGDCDCFGECTPENFAEIDFSNAFFAGPSGCDPDSAMCTEDCNDLFTADVVGWVYDAGPPAGCLGIPDVVGTDSFCDGFMPPGDGPCAMTMETACPSYERLGTAVTIDDCMCDGGCGPENEAEMEFSHEFFSGVSGGSGKGLISTTVGDIPFYTINDNPYITDIAKDDCRNFIWRINATGDLDSSHDFFAYAQAGADPSTRGDSTHWNVTIRGEDGPPTIVWAWAQINSTVFSNELTIGINASESVNCTLHFDGAAYPNSSIITSPRWYLEGLSVDNHTGISVSCDDAGGNSAQLSNAWINVLSLPEGWDNIVWPQGVYEPQNGSRVGSHKSTIPFVFVNMNSAEGNTVSCRVRDSDHEIKVLSAVTPMLIDEDYTLNYLLTSSDAIKKTVPWQILDCRLISPISGLVFLDQRPHNESIFGSLPYEKKIAVHQSSWSSFDTIDDDAFRAAQCFLGYPKYYFNNSWYCDYAGDVQFAVKNSLSLNYENYCLDGIDNDGDSLIDSADHDCRGITYGVTDHLWAGDPFTGSCENGICTDVRTFQAHDITYTYTRYVKPNGTLKVRLNGGSYSTTKPISYSITHLGEPGDSGYTSFGNYNYSAGWLSDCSQTDITYQCREASGLTGSIDYVMWVNLSDYYREGNCYNFSLYLVHLGGDLLIEGIPICIDSDAVTNWDESEGGAAAPTTPGCADSVDNDLDTLTNCIDPDCAGFVAGTNCTGGDAYCEYPNELTCYDCFDNDADGAYDCADSDCNMSPGNYLNKSHLCHYNGEGATVYDPGAYNWTLACADDFNNDQQDGVDCWDASFCWGRGDKSTTLPCPAYENNTALWCHDSINNDYDARVDCADYDCRGIRYTNATYDATCPMDESRDKFDSFAPLQCFDAIDNDLDNPSKSYNAPGAHIDCQDPDCFGVTNPITNETCLPFEYNETLNISAQYCANARDDDSDSYLGWPNGGIDCSDPDCNKEFGYCGPCPSWENISWDSCANNIDDDTDRPGSLVDCRDPDCLGRIGETIGAAICASDENSASLCSDGFDNDADFAYDCADSSCDGIGPCESPEVSCSDNYDNDGDGRIDCADSECYGVGACSDLNWTESSCTPVPSTSSWNAISSSGIEERHTERLYTNDPYSISLRGTNSAGYSAVLVSLGDAGSPEDHFPYGASSCTLTAISGAGSQIQWVASGANAGNLQDTGSGTSGPWEVRLDCSSLPSPEANDFPIVVVNSLKPSGTENAWEQITQTVYEDDAPIVHELEIEPFVAGTVDLEYGDRFIVRAVPSGDASGICTCFFNLSGSIGSSQSDCIYSTSAQYDDVIYQLSAAAKDGASNTGDYMVDTAVAINVLPTAISLELDLDEPFYNSTLSDEIGFSAIFRTAESGSILSCDSRLLDEAGSELATQSIAPTGSNPATCAGSFDTSLLADGIYYVIVNATDEDSDSVGSQRLVAFVCSSYASSGDNWSCADADFDQNGIPDLLDATCELAPTHNVNITIDVSLVTSVSGQEYVTIEILSPSANITIADANTTDTAEFELPSSIYDLRLTAYGGDEVILLQDVQLYLGGAYSIGFDKYFLEDSLVLYGFDTNLSFLSGSARLGYNGSVVDKEKQLELYQCADYNLTSQACWGSWERPGATQNEDNDYFLSDFSASSGFMIRKKGGHGHFKDAEEETEEGEKADVEEEEIKDNKGPSVRPYVPTTVDECDDDSNCLANEYCEGGSCVLIDCPCGRIGDHRCIAYECCSDSDCAKGVCVDNKCSEEAETIEGMADLGAKTEGQIYKIIEQIFTNPVVLIIIVLLLLWLLLLKRRKGREKRK